MHPKSKKRFALKIALSYVALGVLVILAAFFIYNEFKSFASAKNQEESNKKLLKTNRLLAQLYEAENLSKLALQTKKPQDLKSYAEKVDSIAKFIDSLKPLSKTNSNILNAKLDSVQKLLKQKVYNNAELRKLKVQNDKSASLDSVLNAFHEMEVDMGRITPESFAPNFDQLSPEAQESIRKSVAILNDNIPNSGNTNIDSILKISKSILTNAKTKTATAEQTVQQKELQIYRTDLELSQKMRSILSNFEREMVQNTYLDNLQQKQALKKSSRLAAGALILGLAVVILFTILISKDYWKAQQYRERLEKAKKYAESLLKSREQLITTVSHDLRTPLNTISGYSDLMGQSGLNAKQLNYLKKIKSSSGYVDNLVNGLLDYSKLEAGKIQLDKVPFSLFQLIEETAIDFDEIQSKKGVLLLLEIAEDLKSPIINDPFRIRQILTNIIGNAFKFTNSGHVSISADVVKKDRSKWVKIDIEDTGVGIPVEKQEAIFQEFTQAIKSNDTKQIGYGLGLTISKKLTELLGGSLSLKSEVGSGSTFTLLIPVEFSKIELQENNSNASTTESQKLSVLVFDDDENMLGLISELCKINRIKTETHTSFDDFELSNVHRFDMVLTDIQMPSKNGFSVLKEIKKVGYKGTVIAMTGQHIDNKTDYSNVGFSDVLQKPFKANSLLHVLKSTEKKDFSAKIPFPESDMFSLDNISPFLDDPVAIEEVLKVFLENTSKNMALMFSAANHQDYARIRTVSHKMLPMFKQLEAKNVIPFLELLENVADDVKGEKMFHVLSELKLALSHLESEIQDYLAKHSIDID